MIRLCKKTWMPAALGRCDTASAFTRVRSPSKTGVESPLERAMRGHDD
jgi:hypothetical protein